MAINNNLFAYIRQIQSDEFGNIRAYQKFADLELMLILYFLEHFLHDAII